MKTGDKIKRDFVDNPIEHYHREELVRVKYYNVCVVTDAIVCVKADSEEQALSYAINNVGAEAFTNPEIVSADVCDATEKEPSAYIYDATNKEGSEG